MVLRREGTPGMHCSAISLYKLAFWRWQSQSFSTLVSLSFWVLISTLVVLYLRRYLKSFSTNCRSSSFSISPVNLSTTFPFFIPKTVGIPLTWGRKQRRYLNVTVMFKRTLSKNLRFSFFSLLIFMCKNMKLTGKGVFGSHQTTRRIWAEFKIRCHPPESPSFTFLGIIRRINYVYMYIFLHTGYKGNKDNFFNQPYL